MPSATPAKRVLAESTSARSNVQASPRSAKKLKVDHAVQRNGRPPVKMANDAMHSNQVKSQFEEDVLEKMTQDMENLKQNSTEKDQQWSRPALGDWDESIQNLCFQQIEVEEGVLNGGRTAVKLFGVTEVRLYPSVPLQLLTANVIDRPLRPRPCHQFPTLLLCRRARRI
jgi:DNA polymerase delta subunit 1